MPASAQMRSDALRGLDALDALLTSYRDDVAEIRASIVKPILDRPMSVSEAAQYLGVSADTIYRAIKSRELRARRKSRKARSEYVIEQDALDELFAKRMAGRTP